MATGCRPPAGLGRRSRSRRFRRGAPGGSLCRGPEGGGEGRGWRVADGRGWLRVAALAPVYAGLLVLDGAGHRGAAPLAFGWFLASRLSYVLFVGLALRAQERTGHFSERWGEAEGHRRFREAAALLMRNDGIAIALVAWCGRGTLDGTVPAGVTGAAGGALLVLGFGVKSWAARTLGPGAYYWESFFRPDGGGDLGRRGPYRFLGNPMYTLGYAHAYGLALILRSLPGLLAAGIAQGLILLFHFLVERPHNRRRAGGGSLRAPARPDGARPGN